MILVAANALLEALKLHTVHYALDQEEEVNGYISKEEEQEESVHLFIEMLLIAFGDSCQWVDKYDRNHLIEQFQILQELLRKRLTIYQEDKLGKGESLHCHELYQKIVLSELGDQDESEASQDKIHRVE